jgi:hypothetical protein
VNRGWSILRICWDESCHNKKELVATLKIITLLQ